MPNARPRLLLVLPQLPHDPTSGAARTMSLTGALVASQGFDVRALGVTASESGGAYDPVQLIAALGQPVTRIPSKHGTVIRYDHQGVSCSVLDVGAADPEGWRRTHVPAFDAMLKRELAAFRPDVVFTYGGYPDDRQRLKFLRGEGVPVVLGLWNLGYLNAGHSFFDNFAAIITPSQFLAEVYRDRCGVVSTPLATPVFADEVRANDHQPIFFTMVNPTWEKGLALVVRLADMLGRRRPDIPMLVVESRGKAGEIVAVARAAGFDLASHANLMFTPTVVRPAEFFKVTRATLVPSLVSEGSGRVASESLVAGIPPLVSDRGGLPEEVGGAGFVLPLPDDVAPENRTIVSESIAAPWFETIERLADDDDHYQAACARAGAEARRFLPETLAPLYADFFRRVSRRSD